MGDLSLELSSLQETLETEFCPPLDTTIVALLVADQLSGKKPTREILKTLRDQLAELAAGAAADQDNISKDLQDLHLSAQSATTEDSRDVDSVFSQTGLEASSSSGVSSSPPHEGVASAQSDSALTFLRASFPHLPLAQLKAACLKVADLDMDMEGIMEDLLSEEYVRELEERGLEDESLQQELDNWTVVSSSSRYSKTISRSASLGANKKRKAKGRTIPINDVRQKQHIRPKSQFRSTGDQWNQIASISSYLETLLHRPSPYFQSYFHKPEYSTPAIALRAALSSIEHTLKEKPVSQDKQDEAVTLASLMEFITTSPDFDYNNLDLEARARLCADTELSLAATSGSPDVALDVVKLLHELEVDAENTQEMGVYHSPASPLRLTGTLQTSFATKAAGSACSAPVSPVLRNSSTAVPVPFIPPSFAPKERPPPAPSEDTWQTVAPGRPKPPDVHPLAAYIPAYNPNNVPRRKHRSTQAPATSLINKSQPVNVGRSRSEAVLGGGYKALIDACHARRQEALRTASRHWNNGGARNRGGEVALFYAQEAQRHQAEARQLQLDALRELVDGKRYSGTNEDTIDVHYCTTSEALTIVREVLDEGWVSSTRPLRVITGRGTHSSGGVAVLGPAVTKVLEQEGWSIGKCDGGITVNGRIR